MRHVTSLTAALMAMVVTACEQQASDRSPTAPDVSLAYGKQLGGACDAARLRVIGTEQTNLWSKPVLTAAQEKFALVSSACGTSTDKGLMLDYIQWTIDNRGSIINQRSGTPGANLLAHWNTVFPYVGYTGADQPSTVPESIFSTAGAVRVIDGNTTAELTAADAAITSYAQSATGDQRDHLFVIYPIAANCLTGTNLTQFGPCFQFSSFPHVAPKFDPRVKVGICQPIHALPDEISKHISTPALGHLAAITRITDNTTQAYPSFCGDLANATPAGSWNQGAGEFFKRVAWIAKKAVTPEPLYAVHGGLGGLGGGLSPFGAVDLRVFSASFSNDVVGAAPGTPETGTWTQQTKAPGTILVQNSLGQQSSKLAVLNQGGGNCAKCLGLLLQGNLTSAGPAATSGVYDAEWISLQDQSNMKEAPFVLRDASGRDIARVTYAVRSNVNQILYNDVTNAPGTFITNWVQHVPRHFRIRVDLDNKKTSLWLDGVAVTGAQNVPFVNTAANSLATISADFRGIDSGTIGWDEIKVQRISDSNF